MAIPVAIRDALEQLVTDFTAASPLDTKATRAQILGLRFQARALVAAIDAAVPAAGAVLDAAAGTGMPDDMAAQILAALQASRDQLALVEMRALVGRALANLNLAQGV
jgi:hypothetical protein